MYEPKDSDRVDGEYSYRYSRDSQPGGEQHTYTDAGYIPASEAPRVSPQRYSSYTAELDEPGSRKSSGSGMSFGKVVAMCLVCAIIGGFCGLGGAVYYMNDAQGTDGSAAVTTAPPATVPTPDTAPAATGSPVTAGTGMVDELTGDQIYEIGCPQTVGITTEITTMNIFGQQTSSSVSGSGFIISSDGYILTNYHVVENAHVGGYEIKVMLYNGETYPADIVGYESDGTDVAVLKIDATGLSAATIGDSDSMRVGETVYALGNPLGELTYTLTRGMVSALDRVIDTSSSEADSINVFQLDAAINSGNSGGPIYNSRGEVVGIATAKNQDVGIEGLGFAVPINEAIGIANDLIENGYVSGKAYIGIKPSNVTSYAAQYFNMVEGVYVQTVYADTCAERAGILAGDIITRVDSFEITSYTDLVIAKRDYRAGDTAVFTIYRNGEYLEIELTFDEERPETTQEHSQQAQEQEQKKQNEQTMPFSR